MKRIAAIAVIPLFSACAGGPFGPDLAKMTAEQIKEASKVRDAIVTCVEIGTPWGKQRAVTMSVDKGVIANGSVLVDGECKATFQNGATAPAKPATP